MGKRRKIKFTSKHLPIVVEAFEAEDTVDEEGIAVENVCGLRAEVTIGLIVRGGVGRSSEGEEIHAEFKSAGDISEPRSSEAFVLPAGDQSGPWVSRDAKAEVAFFFEVMDFGFRSDARPRHGEHSFDDIVGLDKSLVDAEGDADGCAGVFWDADKGESFVRNDGADEH